MLKLLFNRNTQTLHLLKDGIMREFYIYVPSGYSENISPVSLLFSLHGGGDYAESNINILVLKNMLKMTFLFLFILKAPITKIKEQQDGIQKKVELMMLIL